MTDDSDFPSLPSRSQGFDPDAPKEKAVAKRAQKAQAAIKADRDFPAETFGPLDEPAYEEGGSKRALKGMLRHTRLPPGQSITTTRPVLDLGLQPYIATKEWRMMVGGTVQTARSFSLEDLKALDPIEMEADIHCVTGWSRYDNRFRGVTTQTLCDAVCPHPKTSHVIIRSFDGYSTGLPLERFLEHSALLATHWDGKPLSRSHGGPVRLVVPALYFWKSAKWVKQILFTDRAFKGYWESRGYHDGADPWAEERYGD